MNIEDDLNSTIWPKGSAPVTVIMITLNEGHQLQEALSNLKGWASSVFIVDSYSSDETISIALQNGVSVVQRKFKGFGDQWNFALSTAPVFTPWVMKFDPDERMDNTLKDSLTKCMSIESDYNSIAITRRLWFINRPLPVRQSLVRLWKAGYCKFSDVPVNEHPIVVGKSIFADGELQHFDSPHLDHWLNKQNKYTTAEAINQATSKVLSARPSIFGNKLEMRMWLKKFFWWFPLRFQFLFLYHYFYLGTFRAGQAGYIWSKLRVFVYQLWEFKYKEILMTGNLPARLGSGNGPKDPRVSHFE